MQDDAQRAMLTSLATDEDAISALNDAGYHSIFDIVRRPAKAFCSELTALEPDQARGLHALATKRVTCLMSLYRAYVSRGEPVMQGIPKLGIHPRPDQLTDAVQRSLGGAPDFHDLFPERSKDGYAEATSIQSLFSPGRYLTELYKIAVGLHQMVSPLNIDQRRPDIAALALTDKNMTEELSTLDILIDVLLQGIQRHASTSVSALETTYYPMTLPYHDNLVQIRSVLSATSSSLQQIWALLADEQAQAFSPVTYLPPGNPAANVTTPSPATREELELPPATYALLVGDPATATDIQRDYRLPSDNICEELNPIAVFLDRTGLTFNQLVGLTGQADPCAPTTSQLVSRFYRFGGADAVLVTEYGQTYIATADATPTPLLIAPGGIDYSLIGTLHAADFPTGEATLFAITDISLQERSAGSGQDVIVSLGFPMNTLGYVSSYEPDGSLISTVKHPPTKGQTTLLRKGGSFRFAAGGPYMDPNGLNPPGPATDSLYPNSHGADEGQLRLTPANAVQLADRAERLIRLQRKVGLEFHQLDWLIRNANLAYSPIRAAGLLLDQPVLAAVAEFQRLRDAYGISSDAFTCFIGTMSVYAPANQASLYAKLFTSEAEGTVVPLDATINFDPSIPSDYQSIVAGGLGVSTNELFVMASLAFDTPTSVRMGENRYAQLYRLAMIPRMLGISFNQARLLWSMLDPSENMAATVAGPATLETLAVIRQMETALLWMASHQLDVDHGYRLTTDAYSDSTTPELFNFVDNIYTSLSNDPVAVSYRLGQPLDSSLRQKLYSLTAAAFKVKPNVMGRLIQWIDAHFISSTRGSDNGAVPYGLGDYWAAIDTLFSDPDIEIRDLASVPDIARYSQAMAQHALIALWANLTEQDLMLIVDTPEWFIDPAATEVPAVSLSVLLYISRLKQWQQRVAVPEAEAMGYFKYANTVGQTTADATAMLTYIHGWDLNTTRATNDFLATEGLYEAFPRTFAQVARLETWMRLGLKNQIGSTTVDALYRMSVQSPTAEASSLIRQVAEQLTSTLQK